MLDANDTKNTKHTEKDNQWHILIRYKDGSIRSIAMGMKKAKRTKKYIFGSAEKFWQALTEEDIFFIETRSYIITSL